MSRGSSLERDNNGLLALLAVHHELSKMAEGAMERVVEILKAEFESQFRSSIPKTYPVSAESLIQQM